MKRVVHTCVMLIALVVLCYSAYRIYMIQKGYSDGDALYQKVQEQAVQITMSEVAEEDSVDEEPAKEEKKDKGKTEKKKKNLSFPKANIDFAYLKRINPDICGWIFLEDSVIHYPIVQGSDNETYLKQAYDKSSSYFGSIFMDMRNDNDFTNQNTIIYGHNMKNGSMFGTLKRYQEEAFYQKHKYFYIFTEDKMYRYQVCAIYTTTADSDVYTVTYDTKEDWLAYEQSILDRSCIDTGVSLGEKDRIITLSTCHGVHTDNRFVVQAKLEAEKDMK